MINNKRQSFSAYLNYLILKESWAKKVLCISSVHLKRTSAFAVVYAGTLHLAVATPGTVDHLALGVFSVTASGRRPITAFSVSWAEAVHGGYNNKTNVSSPCMPRRRMGKSRVRR